MPILDDRTTSRVYLPSTAALTDESQRAYVDIVTEPTAGDLLAMADSEGQTNGQKVVGLLAALVTDWNLTDATGNKLAITAENIGKLKVGDFTFLSEYLTKNISIDGLNDPKGSAVAAT